MIGIIQHNNQEKLEGTILLPTTDKQNSDDYDYDDDDGSCDEKKTSKLDEHKKNPARLNICEDNNVCVCLS